MNITAYREEIKLKLTGGLLELELDDPTIDRIINSALREVQRYISSTTFITIPYTKCIDMSNYKVNSVVGVYRTNGFVTDSDGNSLNVAVDPMEASQWQLLAGTGNLYNFQDYVYNYAAWNTLMQIRNTVTTDLAYVYDKASEKLYINSAENNPSTITVEFVPRFDTVDDVVSDYWIDILSRMSLALCKVLVGRIRSRYTQSNALWVQDGQTMLDEGNSELASLRELLYNNSNLLYPID